MMEESGLGNICSYVGSKNNEDLHSPDTTLQKVRKSTANANCPMVCMAANTGFMAKSRQLSQQLGSLRTQTGQTGWHLEKVLNLGHNPLWP